jgi:hypothetical protein
MVNTYSNVNKTNNHRSPELIEHKKRPLHMTLEIQVLAYDSHKHMSG